MLRGLVLSEEAQGWTWQGLEAPLPGFTVWPGERMAPHRDSTGFSTAASLRWEEDRPTAPLSAFLLAQPLRWRLETRKAAPLP